MRYATTHDGCQRYDASMLAKLALTGAVLVNASSATTFEEFKHFVKVLLMPVATITRTEP